MRKFASLVVALLVGASPLVASSSAAVEVPAIIATISVPNFPQFVAVNSTTNRVYVAHLIDEVSVIDGATNAVSAMIPVGPGAVGIAVNSTTNRVYVTNLRGNSLTVIDGGSNSVIASVALPNPPLLLDVNAATNRIYVAISGGEVDVIDGTTNGVIDRVFLPTGGSTGIGVNPLTNRVYVADQTANVVYVVDTATDALLGSIPIAGYAATPIAVDAVANKVYVAGGTSGVVSIIDGSTNAVSTVMLCCFPSGVALDPTTGRGYVTNPGIAKVFLLDLASGSVVGSIDFISLGNVSHGIAANRNTHRVYAVAAFNTVAVIGDVDTTPPTVLCTVTPTVLWPPDHRLVAVRATVTVTDAGSGPAGFVLRAATSNEPDDGLGDGDQANDIQGFVLGTPDVDGALRAERSGLAHDRTYTLTYEGFDRAGNSSTCSAQVTVPHDARP